MKELVRSSVNHWREVSLRQGVAIAVLGLGLLSWAGAAVSQQCSTSMSCAGGGSVSCSTPSYGWGGSCSAEGGSVRCTWTESCGDGCTETRTRVRECPKEKIGS